MINPIKSIVFLIFCLLSVSPVLSQDKDFQIAMEYYSNGEFEKAIPYFEKLAKDNDNIENIHKYYLTSMKNVGAAKELQKYLKKTTKTFPDNPTYHVDYALYLAEEEDSLASLKFLDEFIERIKYDNSKLRNTAIYLSSQKMYAVAEKCFFMGQKNSQDDFHFDLAELYYSWGKKDQMVDQYMLLLLKDPSRLEYVQVALQENLEQEDFTQVEFSSIRYIQKNPDRVVYNELLLWYYIQQKEFGKAFLQARAIDKRTNQEGFKVLEIGKLALGNDAFADAIKIFEFLTDKYRNSVVYPIAKKMLIGAKEGLVKNTYPVDMDKIRSLANDYEGIISEMGLNSSTADAARNMALLQAFYLDNKDTAISILESLVEYRGVPIQTKSQAKLDLGDIYLLKNEPWEASLLYSQVEKTEKEQPLGHVAKLKNAKLSYYKGEFELAKAHLDILKMATSREIANDAMSLSLLIQDNLNLDTTEVNMEQFASIELLAFQGKYDEAIKAYDEMLERIWGHSLTDEILHEKAKLQIKLGNYAEAIASLQKILDEYKEDILGDDANFLIGKLYEERLGNAEQAMEYYKNQLLDFPGSVYNVEARKRFRNLRGDKIN